MNSIKQITLSQNDFIVEYDNSSLKLNCKNDTKKILIDISHLNLISALKVSITCSTYCFIKNFGKKLCWIVKDEEIKRAISILRLSNIESCMITSDKERIKAVS